MPNLRTIRSTSLFGLSVVQAQFSYAFNYDQSLQQVLNRLGQITLPTGVQPQISPWSPIGEILRYRVVGPPGFSVGDLRVLQDWVLQRRFKRVPGVIDVTAYGGPTKAYNVVVNLSRLTAYGLGIGQVVEALGQGSTTVGAGILNIGPQSAVVQGVGLIRSVEDVEAVVLGSSAGVPVLLRDVARVETGNLPRLGVAGQDVDDDVVMGVVLMRRGEQTLPVIRAVEAEVAAINAGGVLPPGVRIETIYNRRELVDQTTHHVVKNIIIGICLVVFIQWLFLGDLRGALVVGATIPFAFFFAVLVMLARGESANLLSLGSLDFGLLVDATVIMVENIYRHLHMAQERSVATRGRLQPVHQSILEAGGEVGSAIFFSALIIVAAFLPLFTMGGIEGRIFGPMAKTYAYAIAGAMLATFTIAPALAGVLFSADTQEKTMPLVRWLAVGHEWLVRRAMARRAATLVIAGGLLAGGLFQFTRLGGEFLPTLEEGSIYMRVTLPVTIGLEEGNSTVNRLRRAVMEFPEVITVTSQQGRPDDGTDSAGFFNAEFFIPLRPMDTWTTARTKDALVAAIEARLRREVVGVDFNFSQYISDNVQEAASGVKGANAVKVIGPELDVLARVAERIRAEMAQVSGVADLAAFRTLGQPTVSIRIDRARAARYGLSVNDINAAVQAAVGGQEAGRLYEEGGDRNFPLVVRLDGPFRRDLDAIGRVPVNATSGATLRDVANIRLVSGASYIYREDAQRYLPVKFSVRGRDPASAVTEAQQRVAERVELPPGYRLEWVGEFRNLQDAVARLKVVVPIALALIAVLLYVQFGSVRDMALILSILPLSCVGGVTALDLIGLPFSVPAAIGFLALFGITVMEGIILLSHFNLLREEGCGFEEGLHQAGVDRMRPVMMTCMAAMVGLLPMALDAARARPHHRPQNCRETFLTLHRRTWLALAPVLAAPSLARAQAPVVGRTARILCGFPAGGTVDVTCRLLAEKLRGTWAPQVVVENRVGATGRLAIEEAIRSDPDGSSILVTPASMVTIYPHLYGVRLRYDPLADLAPVTPVVVYPFTLAVGPGAPGVTDLAQFVEFARARGGISYASPAAGSVPHFTGVTLARAAGIELTHVPYRGAAPAITDAIAGQIPAAINVIGDQVEHHRSGRLRMIAVTSPARLPRFPEVATFAEQGRPELTADEWFGAFLPARAAPALVGQLNAALSGAIADAGLRQNLVAREFEPAHSDAAAFDARIRAETAKWGPVVAESGFRPED